MISYKSAEAMYFDLIILVEVEKRITRDLSRSSAKGILLPSGLCWQIGDRTL
jgi:hypothetical protein